MDDRPALHHRAAQLPGRQRRKLSCLSGWGLRYFGHHAAQHDGDLWARGLRKSHTGNSDPYCDSHNNGCCHSNGYCHSHGSPAPTNPDSNAGDPNPDLNTEPKFDAVTAQALNLSTRMRVLTDANVGIGGFIVTGSAPKQVLLRGIGPSLTASASPIRWLTR